MCSLATRLKLSLADAPVQRLIVCLSSGDRSDTKSPLSLVAHVAQSLLDTCGVAPSDIHDPDATRMPARNVHGRPRRSVRAQTWDSARVADFGGLWCDRLLLGDHTAPSRCALLAPRAMHADALARALRAHRHLRAADVLVIGADPARPLGACALESLEACAGWESLAAVLLERGSHNNNNNNMCARAVAGAALVIGAATLRPFEDAGPLEPFEPSDNGDLARRVVPMAAFAGALWTVSPAKAAEYLAGKPRDNPRLWRTMQSCMLSTRDTAVLRAHASGRPLDARMSQQHVAYLAETLLARLESTEVSSGD